jgi:uncharacterized protein
MSDENVEIIKRLFNAVEERDIEPMWEIYDPDVEINEAPSLPYGGYFRGHEGVARHGAGYVMAWDALQTEDDRNLEAEFIGAGDRVLVRWQQKAHARDGHALCVPVVSEYALRDGRVVESRMHTFDSAEIASFLVDQESAETNDG